MPRGLRRAASHSGTAEPTILSSSGPDSRDARDRIHRSGPPNGTARALPISSGVLAGLDGWSAGLRPSVTSIPAGPSSSRLVKLVSGRASIFKDRLDVLYMKDHVADKARLQSDWSILEAGLWLERARTR